MKGTEKLRRWLADTATTQSALAMRLSVSRQRIHQIMSGARPSLILAVRIAVATDYAVTPEDWTNEDR